MKTGWRKYCADTTTAILFFTAFGSINELLIARMTFGQFARARAIGTIVAVFYGWLYGLFRDCLTPLLRKMCGATATDTILFGGFDFLAGLVVLLVSRTGPTSFLRALIGLVIFVLLFGRPYGIWQDIVRRWFGIEPKLPES